MSRASSTTRTWGLVSSMAGRWGGARPAANKIVSKFGGDAPAAALRPALRPRTKICGRGGRIQPAWPEGKQTMKLSIRYALLAGAVLVAGAGAGFAQREAPRPPPLPGMGRDGAPGPTVP